MTCKEYMQLDGDVKAIVADATCTEILNGDGVAIPGSLVQYPHRNKAVALRLNLGKSKDMANKMFGQVRASISNYGFGLWPVNRRFSIKTLNACQTIIVTSNGELLAELEITDDATLISYSSAIKANSHLMKILNAQPTVRDHADSAFGLDNSNWIPVCEIKDYSVESERSRLVPINMRLVISTRKTLSESLKGQAPLIVCI